MVSPVTLDAVQLPSDGRGPQKPLLELARARWPAVGAFLVGVGLIVASVRGNIGWQSVALEVGAALSLAGVLVWIERSMVAEVEARVRAGLDIRDAAAVLDRTKRDNEVIDAFVAKPSTYTLWAISGLCGVAGVPNAANVETGHGACVEFRPQSPHEATLAVGAPPGMSTAGTGSRWGVSWGGDESLDSLRERVQDHLRGTGYPTDAEAIDLAQLFARAADVYRRRLFTAYERLPESHRAS